MTGSVPVNHGEGRAAPWWLVAAALVPVAALLMDALRPLVFQRAALGELALARGLASPPTPGVDIAVIVATLGGIVAIFAFRRRPAALERVALLGWSVGLTLLGFEFAARSLVRPYVYAPNQTRAFNPDPAVMPGTARPARFTTNREGIRAAPWDGGAYKILCVGGSTTICTYLDDEAAWPAVLGKRLSEVAGGRRYWVGNVGKAGLDSYHHVELIERLPEAAAVDCIVVLLGVNDLHHALTYSPEVLRTVVASQVFDSGGPLNPTVPLFKQFLSYRTALALVHRLRSTIQLGEEDPLGMVYAERRRRRHAARKDLPIPPLEPPLAVLRDNLARIADVCARRGIRLVLVTQPTLWQDPMPPELEATTWVRPHGLSGRTYRSEDLARAMDSFNQVILEFARSRGLDVVDLASRVPKDTDYFYDHEHFTIRGSELVAEQVAEHLASTGGP